jgi:hypothetical protein
MNTRLEYSEQLGKFNQAQALDATDKINGYKTICSLIDVERANRFIVEMNIRYPQLMAQQPHTLPSLKEIKAEMFQFIKRDIRLLEQEMDKKFRRRSKLFN